MRKPVTILPLVFLSTLLTPSFGNHLFANYHVLKHPLTNLILSCCYIPKVLTSAAKILEIGSQIKIKRPKIIWTGAFLPREVTIFPEKNKISNFYAPNFEEVWEAYWFGPVRPTARPSVCCTCTPSRTVRDKILKFGM